MVAVMQSSYATWQLLMQAQYITTTHHDACVHHHDSS